MSSLSNFAARVQAVLAFFTIAAVVGLAYLLLLVKVSLSDTLQALLNTAVGALIAWGGAAISFWLSRHRPQNGDADDSGVNPTQAQVKS